MSKWINRISEHLILLMRTWGSREVTWLIRIIQLFSGWYWDWLSASCFLPQTAAPTCPEERLTLGWNRLSRVSLLLCHVRVSGVALIHSAAPGPGMSLVKATQTSMLLHPVDASLSSCYLTFQQHSTQLTSSSFLKYFLLQASLRAQWSISFLVTAPDLLCWILLSSWPLNA